MVRREKASRYQTFRKTRVEMALFHEHGTPNVFVDQGYNWFGGS